MIDNIEKKKCCGCEACYNACPNNCIQMLYDREGFRYPKIDYDDCCKCNVCEKVCPIVNFDSPNSSFLQEAYILQSRSDEICFQSTSGGAFTGIASYTISNGGIVFGVEFDDCFHVKHGVAEKIEELGKFRNSKYVQSHIGFIYRQVKNELDSKRLVCFSGTPCQVEGLRHFLRKEYDNLILVDVVCRAVPSPGVWERYVKYEEELKGDIFSIRFRDKTLGYQYSTMEIRNRKGDVFRDGIETQPWLRLFFSGMIIRPSCTECLFRSEKRNSDFTIWDCFPSYKFSKEIDENKGATRILVNSEKAHKIFQSIEKDYISLKLEVDIATRNVKEFSVSPTENIHKSSFFYDYAIMPMDELVEKYCPMSMKVILKKVTRDLLNRIGLDVVIKRLVKR